MVYPPIVVWYTCPIVVWYSVLKIPTCGYCRIACTTSPSVYVSEADRGRARAYGRHAPTHPCVYLLRCGCRTEAATGTQHLAYPHGVRAGPDNAAGQSAPQTRPPPTETVGLVAVGAHAVLFFQCQAPRQWPAYPARYPGRSSESSGVREFTAAHLPPPRAAVPQGQRAARTPLRQPPAVGGPPPLDLGR